MITWMQKHKKYLVVTIWVSTIAFVGAGFVGWGAYDFNKSRATSVARVGDIDISMQKFQNTYSRFHAFYSNSLGRELSEDEAKQIGLSEGALQNLIQETLLLNYAKDLGLSVNSDEVIAELVKTPSFQLNGKFDIKQYENTLKALRTNPTQYESELKDQLILAKLFAAISLKDDDESKKLLAATMFMSDKIKAKIINAPEIKLSEIEIKESWEKSKDLYLSEQKYELSYAFIEPSKDEFSEAELRAFYEENRGDYRDGKDKIMDYETAKPALSGDLALKNSKRSALEEYVKIKKGEKSTDQKLELSASDNKGLDLAQFKIAKQGEVLKPIAYNNGYAIFKIENIIAPKPKSFEEAKDEVKSTLLSKRQKASLEEIAKLELKDKKGFDNEITISRGDDVALLNLDEKQSAEFVNKVFSSEQKEGYAIFGSQAVVYEIVAQNLLNEEKYSIFSSLLSQKIAELKNTQVESGLVAALAKRYKIERYYK